MWYIYIVRCSDNTLYTGITNNLERRMREHNGQGKSGALYTKFRRPVVLQYSEFVETRSLAQKREIAIKKLTRNQKLELL